MEDPTTCAHQPCKCVVAEAGSYCSDHCRAASADAAVPAAMDMTAGCVCGHLGCMHKDAASSLGGSGYAAIK